MKKTFIIIGEHGRYDEYIKHILHVGASELIANSEASKKKGYDTITKQVWSCGMLILSYTLTKVGWEKTFDLSADIMMEVEKARKELEEKEEKLAEIQMIFQKEKKE